MRLNLSQTTHRRMLPALLLVSLILLLSGCATQWPAMPPLSDNGPALTGKVIWHDLVTPDLAVAERFYGGLFDWQFEL